MIAHGERVVLANVSRKLIWRILSGTTRLPQGVYLGVTDPVPGEPTLCRVMFTGPGLPDWAVVNGDDTMVYSRVRESPISPSTNEVTFERS